MPKDLLLLKPKVAFALFSVRLSSPIEPFATHADSVLIAIL